MKLQINDAGSWRHIANFKKEYEPDVRRTSVKLIAAVNEKCKLRILDDANAVRAYAQPPNFNWEEKPH